MSSLENGGEPVEELSWLHSPETLSYVFPIDPYHDRLIQFIALKQLGYPVNIERFTSSELPEQWRKDECQDWEMTHFPSWARPVADQEFDKFIDDPDVPGDMFGKFGEELSDQLYEHPMKLVSAVDYGPPNELADKLREFREKGKIPHFDYSRDKNLLNETLLERCFMASMERFLSMLLQGFPFTEYMIPAPEDIQLYTELVRKGQRPVSPEELGALMMDYYQFVEELVPEFRAFKSVISTVTEDN